jgi:hypothetical protein
MLKKAISYILNQKGKEIMQEKVKKYCVYGAIIAAVILLCWFMPVNVM